MTIQLPVIDIMFKQQAKSFITRSARGNAILILKDSTDLSFTTKQYKSIKEVMVDEAKYTAINLQYIKDTFEGNPNLVTVVRIAADGTIANALATVATLNTGWIGFAEGTAQEYDTLVTWTIEQRDTYKKTFKSVVFEPTTQANHEGVVELGNTKVTFKDARKEVTGDKFIPTLIGYLAAANVEKGTTYSEMKNLVSVVEPSNVNASLQLGKLTLINEDDIVKIGLGINSLTTVNEKKTEDFKFIEIIEAQDLILDDIRNTFKSFIGKYKNNYDNQVIFLSAVNSYLKLLEDEEILDENFKNIAIINVEAQRQAWLDAGKAEAIDWDEATVKNRTFRRQVFLAGNIKILQSITDLSFNINME